MSRMAHDPICNPSDIAAFPRPHLAVDLVLMTICEGALQVLMMKREEEPFAGSFVLPGGFVHPGEMLDDTAKRVLAAKVGLTGVAVEQLYSFSAPGRDPRGWVVSAAYFALMPCAELMAALAKTGGLELVTITPGEVHDVALTVDGAPIDPGFDHQAIVAVAAERLRGKLDWSMIAFALLADEFTLFELQRVHEVILGRSVNKPHFRKKVLGLTFPDGRRLVPTGRTSRAGRHRPAELYRLGPSAGDDK